MQFEDRVFYSSPWPELFSYIWTKNRYVV